MKSPTPTLPTRPVILSLLAIAGIGHAGLVVAGPGTTLQFALIATFALAVALAGTAILAPEARAPDLDPLTGLPGRQHFLDQVQGLLGRDKGDPPLFAVLVIDLDAFHRFNDTWGTDAADELLCEAVRRLRSNLRATDLVCRLEADAFAVLIRPAPTLTVQAALSIADRMLRAQGDPVQVCGTEAYSSASVGMAFSDGVPVPDGRRMLAAAEAAMTEARARGPGSLKVFSLDMERAFSQDNALTGAVSRGLENGQFLAWFQPQFSADGARLTGVEALARWNDPSRGLVSPALFLPAVEAAGRSEKLTEAMLVSALAATRDWDKAGLHVPRISVNFAAAELRRPGLSARVTQTLRRFDIAPERLTVEVLESVIAGPGDDILLSNLRALAQLGCRIDMDDFGTGSTSITSLRQFGASCLKIDRSFVKGVDRSPEQEHLISAILTLARQLDMRTLAEGVETAAEQAVLVRLGCDEVQGFGLARPMPPAELATWLRANPSLLAPPAARGASGTDSGARLPPFLSSAGPARIPPPTRPEQGAPPRLTRSVPD